MIRANHFGHTFEGIWWNKTIANASSTQFLDGSCVQKNRSDESSPPVTARHLRPVGERRLEKRCKERAAPECFLSINGNSRWKQSIIIHDNCQRFWKDCHPKFDDLGVECCTTVEISNNSLCQFKAQVARRNNAHSGGATSLNKTLGEVTLLPR